MTNWHEIMCRHKSKRLLRKDIDHWTIGSGEEGAGKTTLGIWDAIYTSWHDFKHNWKSRITYDADEFLMQIDSAPKGATVILDEGVEAIYKRDYNQTPNKNVIKTSTQARERNLNVIVLGPDKDMVDSALLRRFKTWFEVEMFQVKDDVIRGYSEFYSPHARKFNKYKEPFWSLEVEHNFPALPQNIYGPYRVMKEARSHERRMRYISSIKKETEVRVNSTDAVLKEIHERLGSGTDEGDFKNSRGNWDWMKIRYLLNTDEITAKTASKILANDK